MSGKRAFLTVCLAVLTWVLSMQRLAFAEEGAEKKFICETVETCMPLAEKGDAEAQTIMGHIYYVGKDYTGKDIQQDFNKAIEWYIKAAEQGDVAAQKELFHSYSRGMVVEKDEKKAFDWAMKAAEQGDVHSIYFVGRCLQYGLGVSQDNIEALKWYIIAYYAGLDTVDLPFILSLSSQMTAGEITASQVRAQEWYEASAQRCSTLEKCMNLALRSYASAQYNLGKMYAEGQGDVPRDDVEALKWLILSMDSFYVPLEIRGDFVNDTAIAKLIDTLEKRMSPAQRAEAERLASEWKAKGRDGIGARH